MLDKDPAHLTKLGTVTVHPDGTVIVEGFSGQGCSCRDVSALAQVWVVSQFEMQG